MSQKRNRRQPRKSLTAFQEYALSVVRSTLRVIADLQSVDGSPLSRRRIRNYLRGSESPSPGGAKEPPSETLELFGIFWPVSAAWVDELLERLIEQGYLELPTGSGTRVLITSQGREWLRQRTAVEPTIIPQRPRLGAHPRREKKLRELRSRLARERRRPAYGIFSNATLAHLAEAAPRSTAQLARIPGLGETRIREFGRKILAAIRAI